MPRVMSSSAVTLLGVSAAVFLGATQRITGVGFALVASPFIVLILGGFGGVLVVNLLGAVASIWIYLQVRRDADLRRAGMLALPAFLAIVPGAWVARRISTPFLQINIGVSVLIALAVLAVTGLGLDQGWDEVLEGVEDDQWGQAPQVEVGEHVGAAPDRCPGKR